MSSVILKRTQILYFNELQFWINTRTFMKALACSERDENFVSFYQIFNTSVYVVGENDIRIFTCHKLDTR